MNYIYFLQQRISTKIVKIQQIEGQFKKYAFKINSFDNNSRCEIQNLFEHNCEYVYKLWSCPRVRQFIKIQLFQKQSKEYVVKRGQASLTILHSQQVEQIQFIGSKQQHCFVILKFRINTIKNLQLDEISKSKKVTEFPKEQIDKIIKNKNQPQSTSHQQFEQSDKLIANLTNGKYLKKKEVFAFPLQTQSYKYEKTNSFYDKFDHNAQPIKFNHLKLSQSDNKQMHHLSNTEKLQNCNESFISSLNFPLKLMKKESLTIEIKNRRDAYTRINNLNNYLSDKPKPKSYIKYNKILLQDRQQQTEQIQTKEIGISLGTNQAKRDGLSFDQSTISLDIRASSFREKKERKKKSFSQNKQAKQSYSNTNKKLQEVDLQKIFKTKTERQIQEEQDYLLRLQILQVKAYFFKCNYELPKKLIIYYEQEMYQALSQKMKDKQVHWQNKIILKKVKSSLSLYFKIISVSDLNTILEGQAEVIINKLVKISQYVKIYLYCNQIAIGYLQLQLKISTYNEQDMNQISTLEIERKTISLPQINKMNKLNKQYSRQQKINSIKKKFSVNSAAQKIQVQKKPPFYVGKIKQKKLKIKPRMK